MPRTYERLTIISFLVVAVCALLFLTLSKATGQERIDPDLVGTWNVTGTSVPFIQVITFNLGGTSIEYDTSGTNSSASPGESIGLGIWSQTGHLTYSSKGENYIYDSSGNLFGIIIADLNITLASTNDSLSYTGTASQYNCTVSSCPGTFVGSATFTATGTRFGNPSAPSSPIAPSKVQNRN